MSFSWNNFHERNNYILEEKSEKIIMNYYNLLFTNISQNKIVISNSDT